MTAEPLTTRSRLIIGAWMCIIAALGFLGGRVLMRPNTTPEQPIQFNHKLHVQTVELECSDCHLYFRKGEHSGLPGLDICLGCHEEPMTDSPEEAKLVKMAGADPMPIFRKLFRLPDHVYYSHRRHVQIGKLECVTCHGAIADSTAPPKEPLVRISMKMCRDCHEQRGVTEQCASCHR